MRSKNEVLCAAAGRLAAERSEADKPAKEEVKRFEVDKVAISYLPVHKTTENLSQIMKQ
jgi:hypothetical protein